MTNTAVFIQWTNNYRLGEVEEVLISSCGEHMGKHFIDKWKYYSSTMGGTPALIRLVPNMSGDWQTAFINEAIKRQKSKSIQEEKETKFRLVHRSSFSFDGDVVLSDGYLTHEDALSDLSHYEDRFTVELEIEEY
jgi:hypothetical protein